VACEHPDHLRRVADRLEELLLPLARRDAEKITGGSASAVEKCATGWWKKTNVRWSAWRATS
jgi:hypothetical protein